MSLFFASSPKRRLAPMDYINVFWGINMQIAVEFEDSRYVAPAVEEFIKCMNSFRCQTNLLYISTSNNTPTVEKIPPGLKTLKDVAVWMNKTHMPKRNSLATIACDDKRVVVTSSHICNDGMYCIHLIEHICDPSSYGTWHSPPIPNSIFNNLRKEVFEHPNTALYCAGDKHICRLLPKLPVAKGKDGKFCLFSFDCPTSEIMGFDQKTGHIKSITEAQWLAQGLSHTVFEHNDSFKDFGISTVLDLRRTLSPEALNDPAWGECIASVPVNAKPTMSMTLEQLGQEMRNNFNARMKNKDYLSHMRSTWEAIFRPWRNPIPPGIALETSSMGPIHIKRPVVDAWTSLISPDKNKLDQTSFMTYTLDNQAQNKTSFVGQFQANSAEFNEKDGDTFIKMLEFSLKNLNYKMTVKEALDAISNFKNGLH